MVLLHIVCAGDLIIVFSCPENVLAVLDGLYCDAFCTDSHMIVKTTKTNNIHLTMLLFVFTGSAEHLHTDTTIEKIYSLSPC